MYYVDVNECEYEQIYHYHVPQDLLLPTLSTLALAPSSKTDGIGTKKINSFLSEFEFGTRTKWLPFF